MDTFTNWLEEELQKREWKPAYLAHKAGISRGALSNILSGLRRPGHEVLNAIAQALSIPPEIVFRQAGILPESYLDGNEDERPDFLLPTALARRASARAGVRCLALPAAAKPFQFSLSPNLEYAD